MCTKQTHNTGPRNKSNPRQRCVKHIFTKTVSSTNRVGKIGHPHVKNKMHKNQCKIEWKTLIWKFEPTWGKH